MKAPNKIVPEQDLAGTSEAATSYSELVFQFIDRETGGRSEPFVSNWNELGKILAARKEDQKPTNEDFILLVAVMNGEQTHIPISPLITVETFLTIQNPGAVKNG